MSLAKDRGPTAPFSTFTAFKSWWTRLRAIAVHIGAHGEPDNIRKLAFLHHAFWTRISSKTMRDAGFREDEVPPHGALLFASAFNGETSTYIRGFSNELAEEMNALWEGCVGWQGAEDFDKLFDFILAYSRPIDMFFNAYECSAKEIRAAVRLRAGLDALFEAADHSSPEEFQRRYLHVAQTVWGNALEEPK